MKHFLSISDFAKEQIEEILNDAILIEKYWNRSKSICNEFAYENKCIATFFAEPSTRTRFSFERAAHWMGLHVLSNSDAANSSSLTKEETIKDTLTTIGQYCNAIVMRHKDENFPEIAKNFSPVPVINAGSGSAEHPTQALLDLHTIKQKFSDLKDLKILISGDLLNGRTVHSFIQILKMYGCKVILCPALIKNYLPWKSDTPIINCLNLPPQYYENQKVLTPDDVNEVMSEIDVFYMTRIQKERFEISGKLDFFQLNETNIDKVKQDAIILHPLPRNSEISEKIDMDHRAAYHERQIRNGIYVRASLLNYVLKE